MKAAQQGIGPLDFLDELSFGSNDSGDFIKLDMSAPQVENNRLIIQREDLEKLAYIAFSEIAFKFPSSHCQRISAIALDSRTSPLERFVAASFLQNAAIATEGIFPLCQDTGSALVYGWRGEAVESAQRHSPFSDDRAALSHGIGRAYTENVLRASQLCPTDVFSEKNSGNNLPASIDVRTVSGRAFRFLFAAKGGGSTSKTTLTMESPAILAPERLRVLLAQRIAALGASGCPPYTITTVLGGVAPSQALYALELASYGLLDALPGSSESDSSEASEHPKPALRARDWEAVLMELASQSGIGAQWGGSHLALETKFIRLSRHSANLPLALGVSCVAHRKALAFVDERGWFLEKLEDDPARFLPPAAPVLSDAIAIDFDEAPSKWLTELRALPAGSTVLLSGTVALARDRAHARILALLEQGEPAPDSLQNRPIFYAGPTEPKEGFVSGAIGPTSAKRMDFYMELFLSKGLGLVTIGKGERGKGAVDAIRNFGGVYLAAIGGVAALNARHHVTESVVKDYADLGMEAIRHVRLVDLPAIIAIDAHGTSIYFGQDYGRR